MSNQTTSQRPMQIINPTNVHKPAPTYSHVAKIPVSDTATLVTISGQIGMTLDGTVPPDFASQVKVALESLTACLSSAGCEPKDIIRVAKYFVDLDETKRNVEGELYLQFLQGIQPPPDTLLGVAALAMPSLLYEVEVQAILRL